MIKISDITLDNLRNESLKQQLPEFYDLKNVFENNPWHYETTFEHTLLVLDEYDKFLSRHYLVDYLNEKIDDHSRKDLLRLAVLFHDISKKETMIKDATGQTSFPHHDEQGGLKARAILEKFYLTEQEKNHVVSIILNHDQPHKAFDDHEHCEQNFVQLRERLPTIFLDLLILGMADTSGSKLKQNNSEEYEFRIKNYKKFLGII